MYPKVAETILVLKRHGDDNTPHHSGAKKFKAFLFSGAGHMCGAFGGIK
jgi:hypothetical protein